MKKYFILLVFLSTQLFAQQKKLLLIGIDGCRADVITKEFTPCMDSIIHLPNTSYTYRMKNENHTLSAPNWTSMLTGVHCARHKEKFNSSFRPGKTLKYPTFFKYIKQNNPSLKTASYPGWTAINKYVVKNDADEAPVYLKDTTDDAVKDKALQWLREKNSPDVMFIHLDQVDHNGHMTGFSPKNKNYTKAAGTVDGYVKQIFDLIRERKEKYKDDWLVILSTDHGGRKHRHVGGHAIGILNPHIRRVFLIINGYDTQPGKIEKARTVDIAVTALHFFDVPIKKEMKLQGKVVGLK